jgi:hypothetical protein
MPENRGLEELAEGVVFRLANISTDFPPTARRPLPFHFEPSSGDKERARATGHPVLVSVFDLARTTVDQAQAIRSADRATAAFALEVVKIREIGTPERPKALRVLRDPLEPPLSGAPGAEGHCGIAGLDRKKGEGKGSTSRYGPS